MNDRHMPLWLLTGVVFFISFLIYWPNAKMGFVLDDHYVIAQNPVIKNPSLYPKIFTSGLFEAAHQDTSSKLNYYRPALLASFALDYRCWGLNPFAERIVNIVIHAFNSVLVFVLFLLLFKKPERAVLGAIIFCVLPVHEWTVRYITGRGDLLQAFFSLASLTILVAYLKEKRPAFLWGSALLFVTALLSREVAALNIFYVFLITFYVTRHFKMALRAFLFFAVIAAYYYVLRQQLVSMNVGALDYNAWLNGSRLGADYVLRFLMPYFAMQGVRGGLWVAVLGTFSLILFLVFQLLKSNQRDDIAAAGLGVWWIAIGASQFVITQKIVGRLGPVLSEHFLYLESIGFALLFAMVIDGVRRGFLRRMIFISFAAYCLLITIISGFSWDDEENLLRRTQQLEAQGMTVAYEQLAMRFDDDEQAVNRLIDQASTDSKRSLWFKRLGNIYHKRQDYPNTVAALQKSVELNLANVEALNELGAVYLELGDQQRGFDYLIRSLKIDPKCADTYRLLGIALYRGNAFIKSIDALKRARVYDPDGTEVLLHLMMAYYFAGDERAYLDIIEEAGRRHVDDRLILKFAAQELFKRERFADTVKILLPTRHMFIQDPPMLALLAEAQRRAGSLPK